MILISVDITVVGIITVVGVDIGIAAIVCTFGGGGRLARITMGCIHAGIGVAIGIACTSIILCNAHICIFNFFCIGVVISFGIIVLGIACTSIIPCNANICIRIFISIIGVIIPFGILLNLFLKITLNVLKRCAKRG